MHRHNTRSAVKKARSRAASPPSSPLHRPRDTHLPRVLDIGSTLHLESSSTTATPLASGSAVAPPSFSTVVSQGVRSRSSVFPRHRQPPAAAQIQPSVPPALTTTTTTHHASPEVPVTERPHPAQPSVAFAYPAVGTPIDAIPAVPVAHSHSGPEQSHLLDALTRLATDVRSSTTGQEHYMRQMEDRLDSFQSELVDLRDRMQYHQTPPTQQRPCEPPMPPQSSLRSQEQAQSDSTEDDISYSSSICTIDHTQPSSPAPPAHDTVVIRKEDDTLTLPSYNSKKKWELYGPMAIRFCAKHPIMKKFVQPSVNGKPPCFRPNMSQAAAELLFDALNTAIPHSILNQCANQDDAIYGRGDRVWNRLDRRLGMRTEHSEERQLILQEFRELQCHTHESLHDFYTRFEYSLSRVHSNDLQQKSLNRDAATFVQKYGSVRSDASLRTLLFHIYCEMNQGLRSEWWQEGLFETLGSLERFMTGYTISQKNWCLPTKDPSPLAHPGGPAPATKHPPGRPYTPAYVAPPQPPDAAPTKPPHVPDPEKDKRIAHFRSLLSNGDATAIFDLYTSHKDTCYLHGKDSTHRLFDCRNFHYHCRGFDNTKNAVLGLAKPPPSRTANAAARRVAWGHNTRGGAATAEQVNSANPGGNNTTAGPKVKEEEFEAYSNMPTSSSCSLSSSNLNSIHPASSSPLTPALIAIPDSGATDTMTGVIGLFSTLYNFKEMNLPQPTVTLGDDTTTVTAEGWGIIDYIEAGSRVRRVSLFVPALKTITLIMQHPTHFLPQHTIHQPARSNTNQFHRA